MNYMDAELDHPAGSSKESNKPTPRKHYKERIAHAEGYEIEVRASGWAWADAPKPLWNDDCEYRVKPEPKSDVVIPWGVELVSASSGLAAFTGNIQNLRLTFDAETGKLKAAEVI